MKTVFLAMLAVLVCAGCAGATHVGPFSRTYGAGGYYNSDTSAWKAINGDTLDGDVYFVQHSNDSINSFYVLNVNLNGHRIVDTTDSPHNGNPNNGWATYLKQGTGHVAMTITMTNSNGGSVRFTGHKYITVTVSSSAQQFAINGGSGAFNFYFDNNLCRDVGGGGSYGFTIGTTVVSVYVWNCTFHKFGYGVFLGALENANNIIENCTIDSCSISGIYYNLSPTTITRNVVAYACANACFSGGSRSSQLGYNNASSDATAALANWKAGSSGDSTGIVPATEFISISPTNANYDVVQSGGYCANGGVTPGIALNVAGKEGNSRPHVGGVSIGASDLNAYRPSISLARANDTVSVGVPMSNAISNSGGAITSFSITPSFPNLLLFNATSGLTYGTPFDTFSQRVYKIKAIGTYGNDSTNETLTVQRGIVCPSNPIVLAANLPAPYIPTHASGFIADSILADSLPAGLSINKSTGIISGSPTTIVAQHAFRIKAYKLGVMYTCYDSIAITSHIGIPKVNATALPYAGMRVRRVAPGYSATNIYHTIYLPPEYVSGKKYPLIFETPCNPVTNVYTGLPDDTGSGYGAQYGSQVIWVMAPYVDSQGQNMRSTWWGRGATDGAYRYGPISPTIAYWDSIIRECRDSFNIDTGNILNMGFSRGAYGSSAIGMSDSATSDTNISKRWKALFWISGFDGVGYTNGSDAILNYGRLKGRVPQIRWGNGGGDVNATYCVNGCTYFQTHGLPYDSASIPGYNHDPTWIDSNWSYATNIRTWVDSLFSTRPLTIATHTDTVGKTIAPRSIVHGGSTPWGYSKGATTLPSGMSFDTTAGVVSGTPTTPSAKSTYMLYTYSAVGIDSVADTITVVSAPPILSYRTSPISATVGVAITPDTLVNSGGAMDSATVSPSLPTGLTITKTGGSIGLISGTPTLATVAANYTVSAWQFGSAAATTVINLTAVSGCTLSTISMGSDWIDTTFKPKTHSGTVTGADSVTCLSALPTGLTLTKTGATMGRVTSNARGAAVAAADYIFVSWVGGGTTCNDSDTVSIEVKSPLRVLTFTPTTGDTGGGTTVTGTGYSFGATRGAGHIWMGDSLAASYTSWTDSTWSITTKRHPAGPGIVVSVVNNAGDSVAYSATWGYTVQGVGRLPRLSLRIGLGL